MNTNITKPERPISFLTEVYLLQTNSYLLNNENNVKRGEILYLPGYQSLYLFTMRNKILNTHKLSRNLWEEYELCKNEIPSKYEENRISG